MRTDIELRPVREEDLPLVEGMLVDPTVMAPYNWGGWRNPHEYRQRWHDDGLIGGQRNMMLVWREGECLGFVSWRRCENSGTYFWNVGANLLPQARGQGFGAQAQNLLVRYLFATSPVHRIEAATEVENVAEQRCLEKVGFTREGVLRGVGFRDGQWRDCVLYGIVRTDLELPPASDR